MDAMTALNTRVTPARLVDPAPAGAELDEILATALRAPDHGKLKPWRLFVIAGDARARLGALMADNLRAREPDAPAPLLEREAEKPLRAPLIVVVAAKVQADHPKIPVVEQVLSAGCAAQNIQLAAHAKGYGCMWKTGPIARDAAFKSAFGLAETDELVGLLYIGTTDAAPAPRQVDTAPFVSAWTGA
ncbi:MAG: nitroreductase [Alphaproteobacteria bacterium]